MRQELNDIQRIENYLLGLATEDDLKQIEKEINENPDFKAKVEHQKLVMQAVKRKAIRKEVAKVNASGKGFSRNWGLGTMLAVATLAAAAAMLAILGFPEKEVVAQQEDYTFHGLKTWAEPHVQHFDFVADSGATIEGKDGILVIIPDSAFLDTNGNVVSGAVDFELVEALTMDDMVLYNLTTTTDGKPLETGGMFYTNATQNGVQLAINPKRPIYIEIPTANKKEGMMAFKGEVTSDGSINWTDPVKLKKFLVLVDFDNLDFMPPGFEEEVRSEPKDSPFYLETQEQIDSLYYSIPFKREVNKQNQKNRYYEIVTSNSDIIKVYDPKARKYLYSYKRGDAEEAKRLAEIYEKEEVDSDVDTIGNCGGINPLTMQTIRSNAFASTFIATQEFEQRIKELHKSEAGEALVQLYIGNLNLDMWEVDSLVANNLYGSAQKMFEIFKQQKHTNIKDAQIYREQLSAYYNAKKEASQKALKALREEIARKNRNELLALTSELYGLKQSAAMRFDNRTANRIQNSVVSNVPPVSVANSNVYAMQWYSFGWANIDRYLKFINDSSKQVSIIAKTDNDNVKLYQWLGAINTLTPISAINNRGTAVFPDENTEAAAPMRKTHSIAIAKSGTQYSWGYRAYNPYESDSVVITLDTISIDSLKAKLAGLNVGAEPLIKRLKTAQEIIEEQRLLAAKQKAIKKKEDEIKSKKAFECRLREICFGCRCVEKEEKRMSPMSLSENPALF